MKRGKTDNVPEPDKATTTTIQQPAPAQLPPPPVNWRIEAQIQHLSQTKGQSAAAAQPRPPHPPAPQGVQMPFMGAGGPPPPEPAHVLRGNGSNGNDSSTAYASWRTSNGIFHHTVLFINFLPGSSIRHEDQLFQDLLGQCRRCHSTTTLGSSNIGHPFRMCLQREQTGTFQ